MRDGEGVGGVERGGGGGNTFTYATLASVQGGKGAKQESSVTALQFYFVPLSYNRV